MSTTIISAPAQKVNVSDIINNLTSTAANKPLSANMGNVLNLAKGGAINSLSSDIEIIDYVNGSYQIALSAASTYLPARWGVLTVLKSGNQYGTFIFVASGDPARMYIRVAHLINKAWYSDWMEVSNRSDIVNNLTSTATNQPLSAAQGKALNDMITGISAATITGSPVTLTANNFFDISFDVSRTGYTAIAVTGYNLNDRAAADKLAVSGTFLNSNNITAHIYGKCGAADVGLASPNVTVLYKKST